MKTPKPNTVKNPIFAEYYSHMNGDCYKLKLPWTTWREHVLVLCLVTDGIEEARRLAKRELTKHMKAALAQVVPNAKGLAVSDNNHKVWCLANDYHGSRPCNCGAGDGGPDAHD